MSFRTSLRTAQIAYRSISTSSIRFNTPAVGSSSSAGSSSQTPSTPSFDDLQNLLNPTPPPSEPTLPSFSSPSPSSRPAINEGIMLAPKGYAPNALPPKVDPILELFTNMIMKSGQKGFASEQMSNVLELIRKTTNQPPVPLLHRAVLLTSPSVKTLNMRKAMKGIPTPRALTERQRVHQSIAWILKAAQKGRKPSVRREERIAREIIAILEGDSEVFKWLELRHKDATLARANIYAR